MKKANCSFEYARSWAIGIAALLAIIMFATLCSYLLSSAYTSGDDGYTTMAALDTPSLWHSANQMAQFEGRFYQIFFFYLAMIPFVFKSLAIINLFRVYTFIVFFIGFVSLCREVFGWRGACGCAVIFLCLFDTVGGSYNAFHGLPMWFGFGYGLLLFSLSMHIRASRNGMTSTVAFALFGISLLTYEIILLYLPIFIFCTIYYQSREPSGQNESGIAMIRRALLANAQAALYCFIYLVCYIGFRHFHPGTYTGAEGLSIASPSSVLKPILEFSWHSLYWHFSSTGSQAISSRALLYATCGLLALTLSMFGAASDKPTPKETSTHPLLMRVLAVSCIFSYVFIPNILFGFTNRYRIWAGDGVEVYLGSELSAVALTILLYLFIRLLWRLLTPSVFGRFVGTAFVFSLFVFSYANAKNAENFFAQSSEMSIRWPVANWVSEKLKDIPLTGASPTFKLCEAGFTHNNELHTYFRNPDMLADVDIFWSHYFSRETSRNIGIVNDSTNSQHECDARLQFSYLQHSAILSVPGTGKVWRYTWP